MKYQTRNNATSKRAIWTGLAVLAAFALVLGGASLLGGKSDAPVSSSEADLLKIVPDDYVKGPADAPVTLIEYLDFECEACGAYYPLLKQLAADFPNDLRIVTRYFPLPGHRNGMEAALAVEAAARQGKYAEMHDLLFGEQASWGEQQSANPAIFEGYAQELGLDVERFKADVKDPATRERIERDIAAGEALGNTGTPSFFLNGKKLSNPGGYEPFKSAIEAALEATRTAQ